MLSHGVARTRECTDLWRRDRRRRALRGRRQRPSRRLHVAVARRGGERVAQAVGVEARHVGGGVALGAPALRQGADVDGVEAELVVEPGDQLLGRGIVALGESWRVAFGQPAFVTRQNTAQLIANVARASR